MGLKVDVVLIFMGRPQLRWKNVLASTIESLTNLGHAKRITNIRSQAIFDARLYLKGNIAAYSRSVP